MHWEPLLIAQVQCNTCKANEYAKKKMDIRKYYKPENEENEMKGKIQKRMFSTVQRLGRRDSAKHAVGYIMAEWEKEFPWLQPDVDKNGMIVGMYCLMYKCPNSSTKVQCGMKHLYVHRDCVRRHSLIRLLKRFIEKIAKEMVGIRQAFRVRSN